MADAELQSLRDDGIWRMLSNKIALGAEYNSPICQPHSSCLPGTRIDALNALEASLTQVDRRIVWLFGGSGTGKSSIAFALAKRFHEQKKLAATFFFSHSQLGRSNTDRVALTIGYQLGLLHPRAKNCVIAALRRDPTLLKPERSRQEQFECLVVEPLRSLTNVWGKGDRVMIFDAGDVVEADFENREQIRDLVLMLTELIRNSSPHGLPISSILFTSRPLARLGKLPNEPGISSLSVRHDLESFGAVFDVKLFLHHSLREIHDDDDHKGIYPSPWPVESDLAMMADRMKGHFIVASTIIKLTRAADDPVERLGTITRMYRGEVILGNRIGDIDSVYHYALSDCAQPNRRPGVECLADIISIAEPLPLENLCKLFNDRDIRQRINYLSAVVHIPLPPSIDFIHIYHASLRDYILDPSRSKEFHVRAASSHRRLTCLCLTLMQRELKKDILGLGSSPQRQTESLEFRRRLDQLKARPLRYAVLYWSYHLKKAEYDDEMRTLLLTFLNGQLLCYVEVLSLLDQLDVASAMLSDAYQVISKWTPLCRDQASALRSLDSARRLVDQSFEHIRDSALKVYEIEWDIVSDTDASGIFCKQYTPKFKASCSDDGCICVCCHRGCVVV